MLKSTIKSLLVCFGSLFSALKFFFSGVLSFSFPLSAPKRLLLEFENFINDLLSQSFVYFYQAATVYMEH